MNRKTYKQLCDERDAILDEQEKYKKGYTYGRIGLGLGSYYDELYYILKCVEHEMIPYEIVYRMKLYQKFNNKIPLEIIMHIASYGDCIDDIASKFVEEGKPAIIDEIDP